MVQQSHERTLVLIKPDAVERHLVGECIQRFEQRGFRIVAMKMVRATEQQMREHYAANASSTEWLTRVGANTLEAYTQCGMDPNTSIGTADALTAGALGIDWLVHCMTSGPIVALVIEGPHAVEMVRKIVGNTIPLHADIGSIRGDFSFDSPVLAALEKRTVQNLIHASGTREEALREIDHWFSLAEMCV